MYDNTATAEQFSKTIVANYRKLPPREQAHETTQTTQYGINLVDHV